MRTRNDSSIRSLNTAIHALKLLTTTWAKNVYTSAWVSSLTIKKIRKISERQLTKWYRSANDKMKTTGESNRPTSNRKRYSNSKKLSAQVSLSLLQVEFLAKFQCHILIHKVFKLKAYLSCCCVMFYNENKNQFSENFCIYIELE